MLIFTYNQTRKALPGCFAITFEESCSKDDMEDGEAAKVTPAIPSKGKQEQKHKLKIQEAKARLSAKLQPLGRVRKGTFLESFAPVVFTNSERASIVNLQSLVLTPS